MPEQDSEFARASRADFVVVLRASASARFFPEEDIRLIDVPTNQGHARVTMRTRYTDEGYEAHVPRELWLDVRGEAEGLMEAISAFSIAGRAFGPLLAFSANAAVGVLEAHVAFDNTPGARERAFWEVFLPDERGLPRQGRHLDGPSTIALLKAIPGHPEWEYLGRSIAHYSLALDNWFIGGETLALGHLYMAAYALEKAVVAKLCRAQAVSEQELADQLGVPKKALWAHARRELIFQGDMRSYEDAKSASDGLEHGSMPLEQLHGISIGVVLSAFRYVREAILDVVGVMDPARGILLGDKYGEPLDVQSLRKVVRGTFILPEGTDELAAENEEYPLLRWSTSIKSLTKDASGFRASLEESFRVICAEGVQFRTERFEAYGRPKPDSEPVRLDATIRVTVDSSPSETTS
jgi:hypothetical protein